MKYAYVDFDDERLASLEGGQLNDVLEVLYKIHGDIQSLFLDEIQNVKEWPLFVNRMLRRSVHILIFGRNAKLLSGDLATHLAGRSKEIKFKADFEQMSYHLMNVSPTIVVTTNMASQFHFNSEHTAANYVEYLKDAYLLIGIQKYS